MHYDHSGGHYKKGSITLWGAVAMGSGVMIGAGIFALTDQIAQLAGPLLPLALVVGAAITGLSAYSCIRMSTAWPSAGGIALSVLVYLPVAFGVGASLIIDRIVAARDYSLAAASEPAPGKIGFYLTVVLAAIATASVVLANVFAVSRMLAMLTDMKVIPHSHFGMSGPIQRHALVNTTVMASALAICFDLGRIAPLGTFSRFRPTNPPTKSKGNP